VIAGVVFDLDDTLFDHPGAVLAGVRAWAGTLGPTSLAPSEVDALWCALELRHYQRYVDGLVSYQGQRRARTSDFLVGLGIALPRDTDPPNEPVETLDTMFNGYLAAYTTAWQAYDDAIPTLHRVRDGGLAVAVLTNGDEAQQNAKLRATGLLDLCGPVLASSALPAAKPSKVAYDAVCETLDLSADQLLMVGDNLDVDVLGARAAGFHAVHLDRSRPTGPDSIRTLHDLHW
jgi:putative hydrolase of the HAD superfamily